MVNYPRIIIFPKFLQINQHHNCKKDKRTLEKIEKKDIIFYRMNKKEGEY